MNINRVRSQIDNMHQIRDPIRKINLAGEDRIDLNEVKIYANTLAKTRIADLFVTLENLPGHIVQLQNELNRLKVSKMEGCSGQDIPDLMNTIKFLKHSVIKSKKASPVSLPNQYLLEFPIILDKVKI